MKIKFKDAFENNTLVLFFLIIVGCLLYVSWNLHDNYDSIQNQIANDSLTIFFYLLLLIIGLVNIWFVKSLSKNKSSINDQVAKLLYLFDKNVWGKKDSWLIFIIVQIINLYLSVEFANHYQYWLISIPIILTLMLIQQNLESDKFITTIFLGSLLFAVIIFFVINYQTLGVYYHWNLTHNIPLFNYSDDIENSFNIEDFSNLQQWERFKSPVPAINSNIVFKEWGFYEQLVFNSYPILVFVIIYNLLNLLTDILFKNIILIKSENII